MALLVEGNITENEQQQRCTINEKEQKYKKNIEDVHEERNSETSRLIALVLYTCMKMIHYYKYIVTAFCE